MPYKTVYRVPYIHTTYALHHTLESHNGLIDHRRLHHLLEPVFAALPLEERHALVIPPESGQYIDRAMYWRFIMFMGGIPDVDRARITACILHCYAELLRRRKGGQCSVDKGTARSP